MRGDFADQILIERFPGNDGECVSCNLHGGSNSQIKLPPIVNHVLKAALHELGIREGSPPEIIAERQGLVPIPCAQVPSLPCWITLADPGERSDPASQVCAPGGSEQSEKYSQRVKHNRRASEVAGQSRHTASWPQLSLDQPAP